MKKVFEELDAESQIRAGLVCKHWKLLLDNMEPVLWKHLCRRTGRYETNLTKDILEELASDVGWKKTYYWISKFNSFNSFSFSSLFESFQFEFFFNFSFSFLGFLIIFLIFF